MRNVIALVFCLICVHAHEVWANGSNHNTTNNTVNNTTNRGGEGGDGGDAVGHGGDATSVSVSHSNSDARSASNSSNSLNQDYDYEAAASSAAVYLAGCQAGAAAQGLGFGASLGGESQVCLLLRVAAAHQALGQPYEAMRLVRQATALLNGGAGIAEEAPFTLKASRAFRNWVIQPLFGWLPFVGHAV